jgi:hypothetical protein
MLVHSATAPAAVLRTLPALPAALHRPSLEAAWAAAAAVTAAYSPAVPEPLSGTPSSPAEVVQRAADDGDPHAIKFADTVVETYGRTGDPDLLLAADHATALIAA